MVFNWILVLLIMSGGVQASTITVSGEGPDHDTIQAAIDAARLGDTIEVHSGVYQENVEVNKPLILKGVDTGSGCPVISPVGKGAAITLHSDGIFLEGFIAINSSSGIDILSNNNTVKGNTASNNEMEGIYLWHSANNSISGNNISNNNQGIYLRFSSANNTISGNNASNNLDGIIIEDSRDNTITGNIGNNNEITGICIYNSSTNSIKGNTFSNNVQGIYLRYSSNNFITGNTANGNSKKGVCLEYSSHNAVTDNIVLDNLENSIYLDISSESNNITSNSANNNS